MESGGLAPALLTNAVGGLGAAYVDAWFYATTLSVDLTLLDGPQHQGEQSQQRVVKLL